MGVYLQWDKALTPPKNHMNKNDFKPTQAQILAAHDVFIMMAIQDQSNELKRKIYTAVCDAHQFKFDRRYYEQERILKLAEKDPSIRKQYPEDRNFILRFHDYRGELMDNTHDMDGVGLYGKDEYHGSDADIFEIAVDVASKEIGCVHGADFSCVISEELRKARHGLIQAMEPITQIDIDKATMNMNNYHKLIELSLKLLAPHVDKMNADEREKRQMAKHAEYFVEKRKEAIYEQV
jgi:hypothetical protein